MITSLCPLFRAVVFGASSNSLNSLLPTSHNRLRFSVLSSTHPLQPSQSPHITTICSDHCIYSNTPILALYLLRNDDAHVYEHPFFLVVWNLLLSDFPLLELTISYLQVQPFVCFSCYSFDPFFDLF